MDEDDCQPAIDAAIAVVRAAGLEADSATVLYRSNKLAIRVLPSDVFARVAEIGQELHAFELAIALGLRDVGAPVALLEPRVEPRVHIHDGYAMTLWTFYEALPSPIPPDECARALERLHDGMRQLHLDTPHFMDRVASAEHTMVTTDDAELTDADRTVVLEALRRLRRLIDERGAPEQLLHGEPHPGNVLHTAEGPRFIDFETCCRGPLEFDLAHLPPEVSEHSSGVDVDLLDQCRELVLAMVTAWRYEPGDRLPNGRAFARVLADALRAGPPWPTLRDVYGELDPQSMGDWQREP